MRTVNALLILLLAWPTLAWAQERDRTDYTRLPGYFDFGKVLELSDGDEVVEIDLSQPLLGLVGRVVEYDDEALADLLAQLDLVRVNVFSYDYDDEDALIERMDAMAKELTDDRWDNIVRVRSDEEHVNVFVKLHDRSDDPDNPDVIVSGLTILALDDEQAAFINIVGEFGLDEIGRVGRHFDIPHMDELGRRRHSDRDREDRDQNREDTRTRSGGR
jgi:hypothetical protein